VFPGVAQYPSDPLNKEGLFKMFDATPQATPEGGARVLINWAREEGHTVKSVAGNAHGLVIETASGWRIEWGPSQRPYFQTHELRFRCDCSVSPDVQVLWLSKALAHQLESDVFNSYTDATQTRIDTSLPDEMRWLAMHPKLLLVERPLLARRFLLLSNAEAVTRQWLASPVLDALEAAASSWWTDQLVMLMTLNRGILTIRMPGDGLEPNQLKWVGGLFDVAVQHLRTPA
jgi:hypothetical protein